MHLAALFIALFVGLFCLYAYYTRENDSDTVRSLNLFFAVINLSLVPYNLYMYLNN